MYVINGEGTLINAAPFLLEPLTSRDASLVESYDCFHLFVQDENFYVLKYGALPPVPDLAEDSFLAALAETSGVSNVVWICGNTRTFRYSDKSYTYKTDMSSDELFVPIYAQKPTTLYDDRTRIEDAREGLYLRCVAVYDLSLREILYSSRPTSIRGLLDRVSAFNKIDILTL